MTTRLPLMLGQINDGVEANYPGTDVPRLAQYAQAILGCELDRRLDQQLPDWLTFQGPEDDPDKSTLGIAIAPDLMTVQNVFWFPLYGPRHPLLIVRADYQGGPLSLFTTKRPGRAHADLWPAFDAALAYWLRQERSAGTIDKPRRVVAGGLDANQAAYTLSGTTWTAPHDTSVVGVLTTRGIEVLACTQIPATGEHAPVLAWTRIPTEA